MTDEQCWQIINVARAAAGCDVHAQANLITRQLATQPPGEIVAIKRWVLTRMAEANCTDVFTAVNWIDAANGFPEVSGDRWEYHRAWLVGLGHRNLADVLTDPDVLADHFTKLEDFLGGESIELAANYAYERATGSREYPDEMYEPSPLECFPAPAPEPEYDRVRLTARFPKLTMRFGPPQFV
jgi:Protein of unknown function (DUF4240)